MNELYEAFCDVLDHITEELLSPEQEEMERISYNLYSNQCKNGN